MEELLELDVHTIMLTGDNHGAAKAVRKQIGLAEAKAQLLPEQKTEYVAELKQMLQDEFDKSNGCCSNVGTVGMVGDGINDAPALASADVGIAMGAAGTPVAMETADIVLMDSNLRKVAKVIQLGRLASTKVSQNITIAVVTKVIVIGLAIAGYSTLWAAIIADVGSMLLVCLNGMTVLSFGKEIDGTCEHGHGHSHGGEACGGHGHAVVHGHSHGGKACTGHGAKTGGDHGHSHGGKACTGHGAKTGGDDGHSHGGKACTGHGAKKGGDHDHSHGGKACTGHGAKKGGDHDHSHGGKACADHGHGHGLVADSLHQVGVNTKAEQL